MRVHVTINSAINLPPASRASTVRSASSASPSRRRWWGSVFLASATSTSFQAPLVTLRRECVSADTTPQGPSVRRAWTPTTAMPLRASPTAARRVCVLVTSPTRPLPSPSTPPPGSAITPVRPPTRASATKATLAACVNAVLQDSLDSPVTLRSVSRYLLIQLQPNAGNVTKHGKKC